MSFRHLLKYGLSLPPHIAALKATQILKKRLVGSWQSRMQSNLCTYADAAEIVEESLGRIVSPPQPGNDTKPTDVLTTFASPYLEHKFNLLGSGWKSVEAVSAPVPVSKGNRERSSQLRSLLSTGYQAIDWQSDFRYGYRWPVSQSSLSIAYGHEPGIDIKVPWELARLQHLPQLALAYGGASNGPRYVAEFRNQTLDFMATNPPGYGVNWVCTMDVAIRAANLILAYDLFRAKGVVFDQAFIDEFTAAIRSHGVHICRNLEWQPGFRGNHYLADITGLLFVAAFLPRDPKTDSWLAFAVQEFRHETAQQFLPDGSNAEASTNYHRLSAEMAVYGTALIFGLPPERQAALHRYDPRTGPCHAHFQHRPADWSADTGPFDASHFTRLRKMADFTINITKPDGHVVQIGDTDNGRFFKLTPVLRGAGPDEDHLDHRHLVAAIGGLLDDGELLGYAGGAYNREVEIVQQIRRKPLSQPPPPLTSLPARFGQNQNSPTPPQVSKKLRIELPAPDYLHKLTHHAYPDFGLYIWRSERFFLSVRCGDIGQGGNGGHAHNDQLAIELQVNGEDWISDPGSYTYTADTKMRDQYRSHLAHAVPRFRTTEPSRLDLGLFRLENNAKAQCLEFNETTFCGVHYGYGTPTYRQVKIDDGRIEVIDSFGGLTIADETIDTTTVQTAEALREYFDLTLAFSPGYGAQD